MAKKEADDFYCSVIIPESELKETTEFVENWHDGIRKREESKREKEELKDEIKKIIDRVDSKKRLEELKSMVEFFCAE